MLHVHGVTRSRIVRLTSTGREKSDTVSVKNVANPTPKNGISCTHTDLKLRPQSEQKANIED